jgi:hypothetical protein
MNRGLAVLGGILAIMLVAGAIVGSSLAKQLRYNDNTNIPVYTAGTDSTEPLLLSSDDAVLRVEKLPEIANLRKLRRNPIVVVSDHEDTDKNAWVIHVYEDKPDNITTFNWYYVNKVNGQMTKEY